jgi:hypothetical protein
MIGRRGALCQMGAGVLGNVWAFVFRPLICCDMLWSKRVKADEVAAAAGQEIDLSKELDRELARLEKRMYSEQGIPMFLACDNLPRTESIEAVRTRALPSSGPLVAAFRRYVEALPQVRTDATEVDVAKIVELLADQDIASGGTRYSP